MKKKTTFERTERLAEKLYMRSVEMVHKTSNKANSKRKWLDDFAAYASINPHSKCHIYNSEKSLVQKYL